jgi:3'-phosphoadenosine 5'-phosphosulfate sulfotransferase (PAPS reductase)/FAD synthetase
MFDLQMSIDDAIYRIKREYKRTEGKMFLSFSGGKDSTVLAALIKMAQLDHAIPFVFANTGIELDVTSQFVKEFDYENVIIVKPRKPFGQILKEYGKPAVSKLKSEAFSTYDKHIDDPLSTSRTRQLISGEAERGGVKLGKKTMYSLSTKHFHLLHPDREYKIANKCCQYMKKYPFYDFAKDNNMDGAFSGVRTAEGGVRAIAFESCVQVKKVNGKDFLMSMPIIDWSDEIVDEFVEKYDIKLSKAYTEYGSTRTGCVGCPLARVSDIVKELEQVYYFEPNRYKAAMKWMKDVYADQGVELPFDPVYMEYYEDRKKVNEIRRAEMRDKFKDVRP